MSDRRHSRNLCSLGNRGVVAAAKCAGRRAERDSKALFSVSGPTMPRSKRVETALHKEVGYRVFARHLRRAANSFDEAADVLLEGIKRLSPPALSDL